MPDHHETPLIRMASPDDAPQMLDIYAPLVNESAISFELEAPQPAEFAERVRSTLTHWPWLISRTKQHLAGYAYASEHRRRRAYQWCVEVSVYVHPHFRRLGVARGLYTTLFELLRRQGYVNTYAGITLPNPASVRLHEALGFVHIGTYPKIGYKFDKWHDVGWWALALQPHGGTIQPIRSIHEVLAELRGDLPPATV